MLIVRYRARRKRGKKNIVKRLNDFFEQVNKKDKRHWISLCGHLEAMVGNYSVLGAGVEESDVETVYYDASVGFYDAVPLVKENVVAYITYNECIAFVREDMLEKFEEDTKEYDLLYIPVKSFETEELYIDNSMELPSFLKEICWVDDDFLNDENIPFDYEKFEIIDSGIRYVNPKHFSVKRLMDMLVSE